MLRQNCSAPPCVNAMESAHDEKYPNLIIFEYVWVAYHLCYSTERAVRKVLALVSK